MDDLNFLCPVCNKEYPKVVQTTRGNCRACGAARRTEGSRKACFIQRSKRNKYDADAIDRHWAKQRLVNVG